MLHVVLAVLPIWFAGEIEADIPGISIDALRLQQISTSRPSSQEASLPPVLRLFAASFRSDQPRFL